MLHASFSHLNGPVVHIYKEVLKILSQEYIIADQRSVSENTVHTFRPCCYTVSGLEITWNNPINAAATMPAWREILWDFNVRIRKERVETIVLCFSQWGLRVSTPGSGRKSTRHYYIPFPPFKNNLRKVGVFRMATWVLPGGVFIDGLPYLFPYKPQPQVTTDGFIAVVHIWAVEFLGSA